MISRYIQYLPLVEVLKMVQRFFLERQESQIWSEIRVFFKAKIKS